MPVSLLYDPHSQPHHFVSLTLKGLNFSVVCACISISWFLSFRKVFIENCELNKYQWVLFWAPFPSVIGQDIAHVSFALTGMSQYVLVCWIFMLNFLVHIEIWFIWIIRCVSYCSSNWQLCTWICVPKWGRMQFFPNILRPFTNWKWKWKLVQHFERCRWQL